MKVPFLDLARLHESIRPELDAAFDRVIGSSAFVGGREVAEFESAFAQAHGAAGGAGCGSGTDALVLVLKALGIGPGDEVVVPSMTFVATAEAVVHTGAKPVVADVDHETLLLTPSSVNAVRTPRTRAVIPVHLYGHVVPFSHIREWREQDLIVVEDAAQAHLATWQGDPVGTVGNAACFSFYPGKNLGALGDGGMVISRDPSVIDEVRRLRDHGRVSKYSHDVVGWCSRLDGLQAALLSVKLKHLAQWTAARQHAASRYKSFLDEFGLVPWEEGATHHLLVVRVDQRDQIRDALGRAEIGNGIHYPVPLSLQPWILAESTSAITTPNAEEAADQVLSLPMDPFLTDAEVDFVCHSLLEAIGAG